MLNSNNIYLMAFLSTLGFLGYCVYFDRKRRSQPDYKKKVAESINSLFVIFQGRRKANEAVENLYTISVDPLASEAELQNYFMTQLQRGEYYMAMGKKIYILIYNKIGMADEAIDAISNSIVVTNNPENLIKVLETRLPYDIMEAIIFLYERKANVFNKKRFGSGSKPTESSEQITTAKTEIDLD